jgi:hypothetical protein
MTLSLLFFQNASFVNEDKEAEMGKKGEEVPKVVEDEIEEESEVTTVTVPMKEPELGAEVVSKSPNESTTTLPSTSACLDSNGTSHELGAIVFLGCDQRCECLKNGELKCLERCSIPFFKKGSFAHDPLCFEEPSGVDDCCVIVACARNSHVGGARGE